MFVVPYNLFLTYASVYMVALGVSETEVGWITSFGLVLQIFASFFSGYLTDRLGRRWALLLFDLLSWTVATLIWAISQNIWFFIAAALFNSMQKIPNTAWYCLLVEDTQPKDRVIVFTALQFVAIAGGLLAPVGGLLVEHLTLVPAMRWMYGIAFVCMTSMFILRHFYTHDTEIGLRKRRESANLSIKDNLQTVKKVVMMVLTTRPLLILFGIYILYNFQMTMRNTFLSIFLVDGLAIKPGLIAIFPGISSVAMLVVLLAVNPRIRHEHQKPAMICGFALSAAANVMLAASPEQAVAWVVASSLLWAVGTALTGPYLEAAVANAIDDEERANVLAILTVLLMAFISPSGIIGGWSYAFSPRAPFVLITAAFIACLALTWLLVRQRQSEDNGTAPQ
jgi:MFS family permease